MNQPLEKGAKSRILGRKRREPRTSRACLPCQKSHSPCDETRPCGSCVKKGKGDDCLDGVRKEAKYLRPESTSPQSTSPQEYRFFSSPETEDDLGDVPPSELHSMEEIRPFDYAASNVEIMSLFSKILTPAGLQRVHQAQSIINSFIILQLRSLSKEDLILREQSLRRSLSHLVQLLPLTAAPHLIFRRTGEILHVTREFTHLSRWTPKGLVGRRVWGVVWGEDGIVQVWEGLANVVGDGALAVRGFGVSAGLVGADGVLMEGSWWITVKRDVFDIPLLIIACFLPNLWTRD